MKASPGLQGKRFHDDRGSGSKRRPLTKQFRVSRFLCLKEWSKNCRLRTGSTGLITQRVTHLLNVGGPNMALAVPCSRFVLEAIVNSRMVSSTAVLFLLLCASAALGQATNSADVTGTVTDATGAVV